MRIIAYKDIKACLSPYHDEEIERNGFVGWQFDPDKVPSLNEGKDRWHVDYLDKIRFVTKKPNYDNAARRVASYLDVKIAY